MFLTVDARHSAAHILIAPEGKSQPGETRPYLGGQDAGDPMALAIFDRCLVQRGRPATRESRFRLGRNLPAQLVLRDLFGRARFGLNEHNFW